MILDLIMQKKHNIFLKLTQKFNNLNNLWKSKLKIESSEQNILQNFYVAY